MISEEIHMCMMYMGYSEVGPCHLTLVRTLSKLCRLASYPGFSFNAHKKNWDQAFLIFLIRIENTLKTTYEANIYRRVRVGVSFPMLENVALPLVDAVSYVDLEQSIEGNINLGMVTESLQSTLTL